MLNRFSLEKNQSFAIPYLPSFPPHTSAIHFDCPLFLSLAFGGTSVPGSTLSTYSIPSTVTGREVSPNDPCSNAPSAHAPADLPFPARPSMCPFPALLLEPAWEGKPRHMTVPGLFCSKKCASIPALQDTQPLTTSLEAPHLHDSQLS